MSTARHALSATCLASALAAAGAASAADPDPAQASFDQGVALMEAGRFEEGCPAIEQSHKLDPRPGTLFTLAECEALRGRVATAIARFDEYLALYPTLTPKQQRSQGDREQSARKQREALAREVPGLRLELPPDAPPGTAVELDGRPLAPAAIGALLPVDPGKHVVRAQPPGGPAFERSVLVEKGEKRTVALDVTAPPPQPPPPPPPQQQRPESASAAGATGAGGVGAPPDATARGPGDGGRRVAVYLAGGLGLAGLAVGGVTGALAMERKGVVDRNCAGLACNHEGKTAADAMKALGLASTIAFGVGIAGAGAAAVLLLTEPKATGASASGGPWVAAGVAPIGSGGAALDVRGAW
ncbi:tetratricopeptide repeat protein [Sorangium sp. So ce134]